MRGAIRRPEQSRLANSDFIAWWEGYERDYHAAEAWIVEVYRDFVRGKKLIDIGPGGGYLGVQFLRAGARITFMDVAEPNLRLIERICRLKGLAEGASFMPIKEFADPYKADPDHDAVFAIGSLINAPAEISKPEFEALASRLRIGGRFIFLGYPKERWIREGSLPFSEWGKRTDGDATPWMEWYDIEKLLAELRPYEFDALMAFNYHNDDFNWFDLQRRS